MTSNSHDEHGERLVSLYHLSLRLDDESIRAAKKIAVQGGCCSGVRCAKCVFGRFVTGRKVSCVEYVKAQLKSIGCISDDGSGDEVDMVTAANLVLQYREIDEFLLGGSLKTEKDM